MKIEKLLEYQEQDRTMLKIENDLRNSNEAKRYQELQKFVKDADDNLARFATQAQELLAQKTKYEQMIVAFEAESAKSAEQTEDPKILATLIKSIAGVLQKLEALESDLKTLDKKTAEAIKTVTDVTSKKNQAKNSIPLAMNSYKQKGAELSKEAKPIKDALVVLEKDLDKELFEKYKKLRADKKRLPVIAVLKTGYCPVCQMELVGSFANAIPQGATKDCPNCGIMIAKLS